MSSIISLDKGNIIRPGKDKGVYASASDILSNGDDNLLRVDAADGRVKLTSEDVLKVLEGVAPTSYFSGDAGPI